MDTHVYKDIINDLKNTSELGAHVNEFWKQFDNYEYKFPNLCMHLISIIDNNCAISKKQFLYKLSMYLDIFRKCLEINCKIINHFEDSCSTDQLMILNIISILITKINSICVEEDNSPQLLEYLEEISDGINLVDMVNTNEEESLKTIRHQCSQKLCKFIYYFI